MGIKSLIKKFVSLFYALIRKDLLLDWKSEINPNVYKHLKGSTKYKISVSNSVLSGNIKAGRGSKFLNVTCYGNVRLGDFVSVNGPGTRLSSRIKGIEIGSYSSIASNVVLQEDYHRTDKVSSYFMNNNLFNKGIEKDIYSKGKIVIEEDVWIGSSSVVLSGVRIGRGSVIGAGSIVTKDIPRYSIVAGNPARVLKKRFEDHIIDALEECKWWELEPSEMEKIEAFFNANLHEIKSKEDVLSLLNKL
ncbi:CatB-related O-acetyltransferase [Bacillus sp. FJAT-49711]|uniref:CatB-related O-acetyltransferase n=1 Tax=Bacillus sp. FJAT-49711 TaxID=2833585 RepID=UPI001BC8FDDE|nr:CatB-related O-acetyltransferase [Bacillus sp. FJAT-49711]